MDKYYYREEEIEVRESPKVLNFIRPPKEGEEVPPPRPKSDKNVSFGKTEERDDKPRPPTPVNLKKTPKKGALLNPKGHVGTSTDPVSPDSPDSDSDPTAENLKLHALSGLLKPLPKPKPTIQKKSEEPQEGAEGGEVKPIQEPRRPRFGKGPFDNCPPGCIPSFVKRQILYGGDPRAASPPYPAGTRLQLHFRAMGTDDEKVYDDSRTYSKPMEMVIGKKFKLEIWEVLVNALRKGEVSLFVVPTNHCMMYPMLAKILRGALKAPNAVKQHEGHGCCMGAMMNGTGYPDLDELIRTPKGLTFIFELIQVELPGEYEMESWYMTDVEKMESIPVLHADGNKLFSKKEYADAAKRYSEAVQRLDELISKEVPKSKEVKDLEKTKLPLLLNVTACWIKTNEFYDALRALEAVFKIDKENVKGFYRRAQCNKGLKNFKEARADFELAELYDPTLHKVVRENLAEISAMEGDTNEQEKLQFMKAFKAMYHPKEAQVTNRRALRAALNSTFSDVYPVHSPIYHNIATSNPCDTVTVEKEPSDTEVHYFGNNETTEVPAHLEVTLNDGTASEQDAGSSETTTEGNNANPEVPASNEATGNGNSVIVEIPGPSGATFNGNA